MLTFPSLVDQIPIYALSNCRKLLSVVVSSNLTSVGDFSFSNNPLLNSFSYYEATEPYFGLSFFDNCDTLKTVSVTDNYQGVKFDNIGVTIIHSPTEEPPITNSQEPSITNSQLHHQMILVMERKARQSLFR